MTKGLGIFQWQDLEFMVERLCKLFSDSALDPHRQGEPAARLPLSQETSSLLGLGK